MAGKQVYEVPSNNIGGSSSCIAVCIRGMDIQKVNDLCIHNNIMSVMLILYYVCVLPFEGFRVF